MKLKCFESTDSNGTEQYLIPLEDGSFIAVPKERIEHRQNGAIHGCVDKLDLSGQRDQSRGEGKAMNRYIDAEAFVADSKWCGLETAEQVLFALEHQPSIDIVRCKECKYYKQSEAFCENGNGLWQAGDECFCNYGEREGE